MKHDDASWHYEGDFPKRLPQIAGATHIGMFLAWALLEGLGGEEHLVDFAEELQKLRDRAITPGAYVYECCDGKLTSFDLNDEGNAFAQYYYYYDSEGGEYFGDYINRLGEEFPTIYHVKDSWKNFDKIKPLIDARFVTWRASQR